MIRNYNFPRRLRIRGLLLTNYKLVLFPDVLIYYENVTRDTFILWTLDGIKNEKRLTVFKEERKKERMEINYDLLVLRASYIVNSISWIVLTEFRDISCKRGYNIPGTFYSVIENRPNETMYNI